MSRYYNLTHDCVLFGESLLNRNAFITPAAGEFLSLSPLRPVTRDKFFSCFCMKSGILSFKYSHDDDVFPTAPILPHPGTGSPPDDWIHRTVPRCAEECEKKLVTAAFSFAKSIAELKLTENELGLFSAVALLNPGKQTL